MSDAETTDAQGIDPYLTDDLKVYHKDDHEVLIAREFEDGETLTFSLTPDEVDPMINRLIKASNDVHRARNGGNHESD